MKINNEIKLKKWSQVTVQNFKYSECDIDLYLKIYTLPSPKSKDQFIVFETYDKYNSLNFANRD